MKLFISWSGQLSREVGEILRKYLPLMLQDLSVFMSKNDLESGSRWSLELAKELDESQFGVICLTPDNLNSSWILFEAGALTKHLEGRACGLLLNRLTPVDITGPLSQFQHRAFVKSEFFALVKDLNIKLSNPLGESQLDLVFEKWWSDLEKEYKSAIKKFQESQPDVHHRDQQEILEEMLLRVRAIEETLDRTKFKIDNSSQTTTILDVSGDAVGEVLRRVISALSENQRDLLTQLVTQGDTPELHEKFSKEIPELKRLALISDSTDGSLIVTHRLIADYVHYAQTPPWRVQET